MTELIRGPVVLMGQGVDTDQIIPARYLTSSDPAELAAHAFEDHPLRDRIKKLVREWFRRKIDAGQVQARFGPFS